MELSASSKLSLGTKLKQARVQQGLSVDDVAMQLKLLPRIILDLESDHYQALPQPVFVRGYLRLYGELLTLNVADLLNDFEQVNPQPSPDISSEKFLLNNELPDSQSYQPSLRKWSDGFASKGSRASWLSYILGLVLLIVMIVGVWQSINFRTKKPEVIQEVASSGRVNQNVINLPNTTITRSATDSLQLTFSAPTQVLIKDANGTELANGLQQAGDSLAVKGESPFAIELNPASAVQFTFNEKLIDLKPYIVNDKVNFRLSR